MEFDIERIIADGPLNPAELQRRSNISLINHLKTMEREAKSILDTMVNLHPETRQVQAGVVQDIQTLISFLEKSTMFSWGSLPEVRKYQCTCDHYREQHDFESFGRPCTAPDCSCPRFNLVRR